MLLVGEPAFFALLFSTVLLFLLLVINLGIKKKKQVNHCFSWFVVCLLIICIGQMASIIGSTRFGIPAVYFDYIVYVGTCFLGPAFVFFAYSFANIKFKFKRKYLWLFVIPIISILVIWTNDFHHLFYVKYAVINLDTQFGPYYPIHALYTYALILYSVVYLIRYSVKVSGFFSRQSLLLLIGILFPLVVNIIGGFGIPMSIYITPICFVVTALMFALVIFKYDFLNVSPIALQIVVDRISDGYMILDVNHTIVDFNKSFLSLANAPANKLRGKNLFKLLERDKYFNIDSNLLMKYIQKSSANGRRYSFDIKLTGVERYYTVEVSSIVSNGVYIGVLLLFKNITQHTLDLKTINENQDILIKKERLASLGQLVGGIAHNLKTPIMSIAGASEGLKDLIKEYDLSVEDPEVTAEDHHEIAKEMQGWVDKIKDYSEYMSDVITAVKGQTVTLINDKEISFTVSELLKRINILMKHELNNAIVYLNTTVNVDEDLTINGDVNALVQVINNMISNAIQAYNGKKEQNIDIIVNKVNSNVEIIVQDYGPGIPKDVMHKLFREMVTTKGKNGSGLGLYMSYSTIRGHFNGNITVDSKRGKGTAFKITLPLGLWKIAAGRRGNKFIIVLPFGLGFSRI